MWSSSFRCDSFGFLRPVDGPRLERSAFASSTTSLPRIMLRTPKSSSLMSSMCPIPLRVCRSAMIANLRTTLSNCTISLKLSSSESSSSAPTSSLNLKTVVAIWRTIESMPSRGCTASLMTMPEMAPLQTTMKNTTAMVLANETAASTCAYECMLKLIIKVSVWRCKAEANCGASTKGGVQLGLSVLASVRHLKVSWPAERVALPPQMSYGPYPFVKKPVMRSRSS
mmetsp:Transcript_3302/g.9549  ORF Transcript_3302/g.9549 Transcript_3302/m.9549 type:complete len:226 (-) Transcript_3302:876-1553(-)